MSNSETARSRHLVEKYCVGNGVDCGSAGDPICSTSIQIELKNNYCPFFDSKYPPQLRGDATKLIWFKDEVLDYVFSSHLIEDFTAPQQETILKEWGRVVKPGGYLVILAPEKGRWKEALDRGQPPNLAHKNEPLIGEFTDVIKRIGGFAVIEDRFCEPDDPFHYGMMFVAQKNTEKMML